MKSIWIALILSGCLLQPTNSQNKDSEKLKFPKGFLWGAASAAYQVEGNTKADGRGPNIWDKYLNPPYSLAKMATGEDVNGDVSINEYDRNQFLKGCRINERIRHQYLSSVYLMVTHFA